ncbi:hypothetical protein Daura_27925 [Dactylosporangium aurantiacum]|uniref:Uncharacterized protein n=1 Tax=Dactylosporangium aurantiacum TaxID=35754 RepID=A0A9Q9IAX5_9ACTN|nr:hypothetical protein [Dactylosporangium aurantiacum]MDG6106993.1 hypothetical protein [Dactylosporangium aurantiacum]UWZ50647.1 hypothetical protein Daura_27925 [Dactylosporangium aurantiacum]
MSSIASIHVLQGPDVKAFAESGVAPEGRQLHDAFHWSGYFMLYLMLFLDEQGVPVSESRHDEELAGVEGLYFLLTTEHQQYLPRLDPASFDQAAFGEYLDEMGFADFDEAPVATRETLELLRGQLAALTGDEALLIDIG